MEPRARSIKSSSYLPHATSIRCWSINVLRSTIIVSRSILAYDFWPITTDVLCVGDKDAESCIIGADAEVWAGVRATYSVICNDATYVITEVITVVTAGVDAMLSVTGVWATFSIVRSNENYFFNNKLFQATYFLEIMRFSFFWRSLIRWNLHDFMMKNYSWLDDFSIFQNLEVNILLDHRDMIYSWIFFYFDIDFAKYFIIIATKVFR